MEDFKKYGERVQLERKEKKLSQEQLAKNLKITKQALSRIERGQNKSINKEHLRFLADFFQCTKDYLLGRSNDRKKTEDNLSMPIYKDKHWELKQRLFNKPFANLEFVENCIDCDENLSHKDIDRLVKIMKIFLEKST